MRIEGLYIQDFEKLEVSSYWILLNFNHSNELQNFLFVYIILKG